jgi:hypothetical protein
LPAAFDALLKLERRVSHAGGGNLFFQPVNAR